MSSKRNARITKKLHTRYLADFFIEASQDQHWGKKLQALTIEGRLNTAEDSFPEHFVAFFPETQGMELAYSIERVRYEDVPRSASCWWPLEDNTHYYIAYPNEFPQVAIYMAIDFDDHHHGECCA